MVYQPYINRVATIQTALNTAQTNKNIDILIDETRKQNEMMRRATLTQEQRDAEDIQNEQIRVQNEKIRIENEQINAKKNLELKQKNIDDINKAKGTGVNAIIAYTFIGMFALIVIISCCYLAYNAYKYDKGHKEFIKNNLSFL